MTMWQIVYWGCRISTRGGVAPAYTDPFWGLDSLGGFGYDDLLAASGEGGRRRPLRILGESRATMHTLVREHRRWVMLRSWPVWYVNSQLGLTQPSGWQRGGFGYEGKSY